MSKHTELVKSLRSKTKEELLLALKERKKEALNLRFKKAVERKAKSSDFKKVRKEIAIINFLIHSKYLERKNA